MTKIHSLIIEEAARFRAAYGMHPEFVFIGAEQAREIDALVAAVSVFGWTRSDPVVRAMVEGLEIFRVDAESHLSFGVRQPSPCG